MSSSLLAGCSHERGECVPVHGGSRSCSHWPGRRRVTHAHSTCHEAAAEQLGVALCVT